MTGKERLIGRDDMLAVGYRAKHIRFRRLDAADQLDDNVHVGTIDHLLGIGGEVDAFRTARGLVRAIEGPGRD